MHVLHFSKAGGNGVHWFGLHKTILMNFLVRSKITKGVEFFIAINLAFRHDLASALENLFTSASGKISFS